MLLSAGYELPRQLFIHGCSAGPRRPPHVEDARQRHGSYRRRSRPTAPTRCATTCCARSGSGRTAASATRRLHDRYHGELANELGNLVSRSDRDDRALPRRRRPGRSPVDARARRARATEVADGLRARASTRSTSRARSSRSGSSCARSTASSRSARRGSSRRATSRRDAARARRDAARRCADGVRVLGVVLRLGHARHVRRGCSPPSAPSRRDVAWESARERRLAAGARSTARRRRSSRASSRRPSRRDRHPRAPAGPAEGGADAAIEEAAAAGVDRIVCVGDSPELARGGARAVRAAHPGVRRDGRACTRTAPSSGATSVRGAARRAARATRAVVAVGECGLDYYRERAPRDAQARGVRGPGRARRAPASRS